jgi:hypothetical protein
MATKRRLDETVDELSQIMDHVDLTTRRVKCRRCGEYYYTDDESSSSNNPDNSDDSSLSSQSSESSEDSLDVQVSPVNDSMIQRTDLREPMVESDQNGLPNCSGSGQT